MSNFPRVRLLWSQLSALNADEIEQFDTELTQTINAYGGSTHAPLAPIVIGQGAGNVTAGLWVTGHAILDNAEGHVNSGYAWTIDGGATLEVNSGGGVQVENGGAVSLLDGAQLILNADSGAGGSELIVGGLAFFNHDSVTTISGTSGHVASFLFSADTQTAFAGSAGHIAQVAWGAHSTTAIASGSAWTDAGTWTRTGTETWTTGSVTYDGTTTAVVVQNLASLEFKTGSLLQMDANTALRLNGATYLSATQPSKNQDPGANNLLFSTNTTKAWCSVTTNGVGGITFEDGFNVASVAIVGTDIQVNFARNMLNAFYVVSGSGVGLVLPITGRAYAPSVQSRAVSNFIASDIGYRQRQKTRQASAGSVARY